MTSCDEPSISQDELYLFSPELIKESKAKGLDAKDYLCPELNQNLTISGSFYKESFDFIQIEVMGCDYEDESLCQDMQTADIQQLNFLQLQYIVDLHELD